MPFRLPRDARRWFAPIRDRLSLDFDVYHMCLVAGLAVKRTGDVQDRDTTVLIEHFPSEYRRTARIIIALFLATEMRRLNIISDRKELHRVIGTLMEPNGGTLLSTSGMRKMNQYAYGGFDVIREWFGKCPETFEGFFLPYQDKVEEAMSEEK